MSIVKKVFDLLTQRERRDLYFLFVAVFVMAGLEVVSVASIMPFLSVASEPAMVKENKYLYWIYTTFEFTDINSFLIALGLGALAVLLISNAFIVFTRWALERYVWGRNHSLSRRLLRTYLYRPYEYFLTQNSAELGKNILEEVKEVTDHMLRPALYGLAKTVVALFIIIFLIFVDPIVALTVSLVLGSAYGGIYLIARNRLDTAGSKRVAANTLRYQYVSEALGGIKEVKLRGKEETFLDQFDFPSERYAQYQALYRIISKIPQYILEAVAFGGIILITVYLIAIQNNIRQVVPMLGLYAFAGYRLLPALQQAFKGLASARFNTAALQKLHRDLRVRTDSSVKSSCDEGQKNIGEPLTLCHQLTLEKVYFTYPNAEKPAIKDLTLEIPARTTVGFVGKTGSGKTTVINLILGLLRPQKGNISVDGTPIREDNLREWQREIGYVPQKIYLSDDTIARNIAFGVPHDDIDMDDVRKSARMAQIYDFIVSELPYGFETTVGERGIKLSGGQQQRIGIARALYHQPSVLVLDEATSALDQSTEENVMKAIYELEGDHTILMIAHRLSTVRRADNIIMLEGGEKVGEGIYSELVRKHSKFKSMALS